MTKLKITDPDTGREWLVEALDERDPEYPRKYWEQLLMFGHVYVYRNGESSG